MAPRVSARALTLTQPCASELGVLGEASGLRELDGLQLSVPIAVRKASASVAEGQSVEEAQLSTHTTATSVAFRVQPAYAHHRRLGPDNQGQSESESLAQKTLFWVMQQLGLVT